MTKRTTTTDTTTTLTPESTKTTTVKGAPRSDAIILALLGTGALAVFGAAFFGRLESIGGAGFTLTFKKKADEVLTKLTEAVAAVAKRNQEQDAAFKAIRQALDQLDARVDALEGAELMTGLLPLETPGRVLLTRQALNEYATATERSSEKLDESVELVDQARQALAEFRATIEQGP